MSDGDIPDGYEALYLGEGFIADFGTIYIDRSRGRLAFRAEERHGNPVGMCQGGALATFADVQVAVASSGAGTAAGHTPTVSLAMDYLAPAPIGAWIEAEVILAKRTRTLIFTQATITADGEPVARSSAIYRNIEPTGA